MARSKTKRGDKEFDLVDRLKHENAKLKRELSKMKKLVQRADFERLDHLEKLVDEQRKFDKTIRKDNARAREKWLCHDCGRGYMMPRIFRRRDGDFYYRMCNNEECSNRTRMKKLTKDVDLSLMGEKDD